jgi:hypothetical protein
MMVGLFWSAFGGCFTQCQRQPFAGSLTSNIDIPMLKDVDGPDLKNGWGHI